MSNKLCCCFPFFENEDDESDQNSTNGLYAELVKDNESHRTDSVNSGSRSNSLYRSASKDGGNRIFRGSKDGDFRKVSVGSADSNGEKVGAKRGVMDFFRSSNDGSNNSNSDEQRGEYEPVLLKPTDAMEDDDDDDDDQGLPPNSSTSVLNRALLAQRIRNNASNNNQVAYSPSVVYKGFDQRGKDVNAVVAPKAPGSNNRFGDEFSAYEVQVLRWTTRRTENNAASDNNNNNDNDDGSVEAGGGSSLSSSVTAEIEYELCVSRPEKWKTLTGNSLSTENMWSKASSPVDGKDDDRANSNNNNKGKDKNSVSVWRTAREVMLLHTVVVTALGDHAPRRPRLRTLARVNISNNNNNSLNIAESEDIQHDMRAIAVFVKALLRQSSCSSIPAVIKFLTLDAISNSNNNSNKKNNNDLDASDLKPVPVAAPTNTTTAANINSTGTATSSSSTSSSPSLTSPLSSNAPLVVPTSTTTTVAVVAATSASSSSSFGEAAASVQAAQPEKDKWRKLFLKIRVKLKPHEVAIRTRLFEGVFTGTEIVDALLNYFAETHDNRNHNNNGNNSTVAADGSLLEEEVPVHEPHDRGEACSIGQELLNSELLVAITSGYQPTPVNPAEHKPAAVFADDNAHVYRFPLRSNNTMSSMGNHIIFGSRITITVPRWIPGPTDNNNNSGSGPSTPSVSVSSIPASPVQSTSLDNSNNNSNSSSSGKGLLTRPSLPTTTPSNTQFVVRLRQLDDSWEVSRREDEFAALSKTLQKQGVYPTVQFPSKLLLNLSNLTSSAADKNTALCNKLEAYLISVLKFVIKMPSNTTATKKAKKEAMDTLAEFFDKDFNYLIWY